MHDYMCTETDPCRSRVCTGKGARGIIIFSCIDRYTLVVDHRCFPPLEGLRRPQNNRAVPDVAAFTKEDLALCYVSIIIIAGFCPARVALANPPFRKMACRKAPMPFQVMYQVQHIYSQDLLIAEHHDPP